MVACKPKYRRHIRGAALAVMLPLTLWSGLPSTGCVCPNGAFMLFCHRCVRGELQPEHRHVEQPAHRSCCSAAPADAGEACCTGGGRTAPSSPSGKCTPVLNARFVRPAPVAAVHSLRLSTFSALLPVETVLPSGDVRLPSRPGRSIAPIPDLVIEFRVLRI